MIIQEILEVKQSFHILLSLHTMEELISTILLCYTTDLTLSLCSMPMPYTPTTSASLSAFTVTSVCACFWVCSIPRWYNVRVILFTSFSQTHIAPCYTTTRKGAYSKMLFEGEGKFRYFYCNINYWPLHLDKNFHFIIMQEQG